MTVPWPETQRTHPEVDPTLATPLDLPITSVECEGAPDEAPHVWRVPLRQDAATRCRLEATLSDEERARARRFRVASAAERFVVAHGVLRTILGVYLERAPERLSFTAGPEGKPCLAPDAAPDAASGAASGAGAPGLPLRFNLSHSADLALVAVAVGGAPSDVGVDVEQLNARVEALRLARRFFAPEERNALEAFEGDERVAEFFRIWTLKEAYLKALGVGLRRALDSFAVTPPETDPPRLLRSDAGDRGEWIFQRLGGRLGAGDGYAAALAWRRRRGRGSDEVR